MSPLFHTLSSGVTRYYEVAFPSDGVTVTLDVTQGSVTVYASDNIWNANAQDYDWRVTADTASGFIEAFFNSSTLNRQVRSILFLAIVGGQSANTYIMNNAVGDIRTIGESEVQSPKTFIDVYVCLVAKPPRLNMYILAVQARALGSTYRDLCPFTFQP